MKNIIFALSLLFLFALSACSGGEAKKSEESSANTTKNEEKKQGITIDGIELVNHKSQKIGFTMLVPKSGKISQDDETGFAQSLVMDNNEGITMVVLPNRSDKITSIAEYKKGEVISQNWNEKDIIKEEKTTNGFMVIHLAKGYSDLQLHHYVVNNQIQIEATKKFQKVAEKMAKSFKVIKKTK